MTQKQTIHWLAALVLVASMGMAQGCSKQTKKPEDKTVKPTEVQKAKAERAKDAGSAETEARNTASAESADAGQGTPRAAGAEEKIPAGAAQAQVIILSWKGAMDGVKRTKEQAKTLAGKVLAETAKTPFDTLVAKYSDGPNKKSGGKVPPMTKKDASAVFQPVFSLKVGQVSKVIEGPNGYYIFKRIK